MKNNSTASTHYTTESGLSAAKLNVLASLMLGLIISVYCICAHAATDATSFYSNFANLTFKNQHNQAFNTAKLTHKVVLFNFIYTQCATVCSVQTKALVDVVNALPKNVRAKVALVSVSLDPLSDTPEKLSAFAKQNHADFNNWYFITSKPDDVKTLSDRLKLFGADKKTSDAAVRPNDHITHLWLVDNQGRLIMRYLGNPIDKARLAREMEQLSNI
jgi:cytochrome oxidase Cu insertion factor (SCO1/SenC/PrrC family)